MSLCNKKYLRHLILFLSCRRVPERPWFQYHWSQGRGGLCVWLHPRYTILW